MIIIGSPQILNTSVLLLLQVPRTNHGGIGLYQCKDGYVLKGPNTTRCNFGNWTDVTPACELVYCPFPGYIDKGKVIKESLDDVATRSTLNT